MKKSYTLFFILALVSNLTFAKSIYVSKSTGSSDGDGSSANPFITIGQAVDAAVDNDVIYLMDGVFRETVNITKSNITIFSDDKDVYITGTDVISGFEDLGNGLYKAYAPDKVTQLFIDGVPQVNAKYPNQDINSDPFVFSTMRIKYDGEANTIVSTSGDLTQPDGFFDGATVWMIVGDRWVSETAKVTKYANNTLELENVSWHYDGYGIGFISNCKNCLDNDNEWYWGNDTLYYINSSIDMSSVTVEAKTRENLFYLDGVQNVIIDGVNGYAGNVLLDGTQYCKITNGTYKYLTEYDYFGDSGRSYCRGNLGNINSYGLGIAMFGTADTLSNCTIAYSAGDCVTLYGKDNVVQRNVMHDANYRANDCGVVSIYGTGNQILRCDAYNAGRDLISASGAKSFKILYNNLHRTGLIAWDLGIIYTWGTDGEESEIAFNHISEAYSGNPDDTWGAVGVYLDNGSQNFLVHHNVIHDIKGMGMQFNYPGYNLRAYNNTIYNTVRDMSAYGTGFPGVTPGKCKLYNNYSDKRILNEDWTDTRNNWISTTDYLQDRDNGNYVPKEGAVIINTAMFAEEMIRIPFAGDGPDVGAYEYGRTPWEVGPSSNIVELTKYMTLRDTSGMVLRGTPMVIGKKQQESLKFAMNLENWQTIKNNGFNTIRICWVDPWYKDRGEDNWSVTEVLPYLDTCVMNAATTGMNVIIDFHNPRAQDNYDTSYSFDKEKEFWSAVASRYKDNESVYFELVDEPTSNLDTFEKPEFISGMMDVYNTVRSAAPDREVLMFSFNTIDNKIVEVVEAYEDGIDWGKTSVAYHMYNLSNSAAVQTLMADYRVVCTQWDYSFVRQDGDNDIMEVDGYKENSQTLESIYSSWIDWRQWSDTTLNELLDTLIVDARTKDYWWGETVPGLKVTGINIIEDSVSLTWGMSKQLTGHVYPALSENQVILWSSSNPDLVQVDNTGNVTSGNSVLTDTVFVYAVSDDGGYRDSCEFIFSPSADKCAYPKCIPHDVPGEINATYYDKGGEGVGYHDLTAGNSGDGPRQDEDVDTDYKLAEGSVMDIQTGEWLEYIIDVKESGDYNFDILFATPSRFGKFHIEIDGKDVTGIVYAKASGSFDVFKSTIIENIPLTEGLHILRIYFDYAYYNMGTITIQSTATGISEVKNVHRTKLYPNPVKNKIYISSDKNIKSYKIYTISGQVLMQNTINEYQVIDVSQLPGGYYIITLSDGNEVDQIKFVKY